MSDRAWQLFAFEHDLALFKRRFSKDGQPQHAWMAMRICDDIEKPYPAWVMDYLQETALRITSYFPKTVKKGGEDKRLAQVLSDGLGDLGMHRLTDMYNEYKTGNIFLDVKMLRPPGSEEDGLKPLGRNIGEAQRRFQLLHKDNPLIGKKDAKTRYERKTREIKKITKALGKAATEFEREFGEEGIKALLTTIKRSIRCQAQLDENIKETRKSQNPTQDSG